MNVVPTILQNLIKLRSTIEQFEQKYKRTKGSVRFLAASKTQPVSQIREAIAFGVRLFGENYLQEALPKIEALADEMLEWHFIGTVQTNKTAKIAKHFAWVHSLAANKIAKRLNDQRPIYLPPLKICIEVNVSQEVTKSGVSLEEVFPLAHYCMSLPRLCVTGLMTLAKKDASFEEQRTSFAKLRALKDTLCASGIPITELSMGTSHEIEAAIAEGATLLRIGTALFGKR